MRIQYSLQQGMSFLDIATFETSFALNYSALRDFLWCKHLHWQEDKEKNPQFIPKCSPDDSGLGEGSSEVPKSKVNNT